MSQKRRRRKDTTVDKWKSKTWYNVFSPDYFGKVQIAEIPGIDKPDQIIGRTVETTLYEITNDFSQTHIKLVFKINDIEGINAHTKFYGHDFTRDYLRSLVRRTTSRIDGIFNVTVKDKDTSNTYKVRVTAVVFTQKRAKTSQQKAIRTIMKQIIEDKASQLNFIEFIQECVLGRIGSEIYNNAKIIYPIRKSEVMKTKVITEPQPSPA